MELSRCVVSSIVIFVLIIYTACIITIIVTWSLLASYDNDKSSTNKPSVAPENWANMPLKSYYKFHIFNYTNIDNYLMREDEKIKVEEIGPFTFQLNKTKQNIKFNSNNTITFNNQLNWQFLPEKSFRNIHENVTIPNVPVLDYLYDLRKKSTPNQKYYTSRLLKHLEFNGFLEVPIEEFLTGYSDKVFNRLRKLDANNSNKIQMFEMINGTSLNSFQIHSGADNAKKVGIISQFNGCEYFSSTSQNDEDECNRVDGSYGFQFPHYLVQTKQSLTLFSEWMSRTLSLNFEKETTTLDGIDVWSYTYRENIFDKTIDNPRKVCNCNLSIDKSCPPIGVFRKANRNNRVSEVFLSFPHFFSGDPVLYSKFEGVRPNAEKHRCFVDIHSSSVISVDGAIRFQYNIYISNSDHLIKRLDRILNDILLPVFWVEETADELSEDQRSLIDKMNKRNSFLKTLKLIKKYAITFYLASSYLLIVLGVGYMGILKLKKN